MIQLNLNEAELNDNAWDIFNGRKKINSFLSTESVEISTMRSLQPNSYFLARFQLADRVNQY